MNNEPTLIGALALAVTALASVIAYVARMLWKKLFDDEKGLVTKLIVRHLKFVDESAEIVKSNAESQRIISVAVTEIREAVDRTATATEHQEQTNEKIAAAINMHNDELTQFSHRFPNTPDFSTVKTNDAIHHLALAGRAHLDGNAEQARRELDEAELAVNSK